MTASNPVVSYDRDGDVLYVAYLSEGVTHAVDKDGVLHRYGSDGQLVGITIVDFSDWLWRCVGEGQDK